MSARTKVSKVIGHKLNLRTCVNLILLFILFLEVISFSCCKKEEDRIMAVRNDSISDISYTTAKANATIVDIGQGIKQHGHCWSSETTTPVIGENNKSSLGSTDKTGNYESQLVGLSERTVYYVRAYAISDAGTAYGDTLKFKTYGKIIAGFDANPKSGYLPLSVQFTDRSIGDINSWSWNFGDLGTSTSQNSSYQYNRAGVFTVTLSVTNSFGSDFETKHDYITVLSEQPETVTDYDGNEYNTVQIGGQVWMAENLPTTHYSDGTALVDGTGAGDISDDYTTNYYFAYGDNQSNVATYGRIYTWAAVMNGAASSNSNPSGVRGVCPAGWHVPSDNEWKQMEMNLGMTQSEADNTDWRGTNEGGKLKEVGTTHWNSPNTGATNERGFKALPSGFRGKDGTFDALGNGATFWLSTEYNSSWAWYRTLWYSNEDVYRN